MRASLLRHLGCAHIVARSSRTATSAISRAQKIRARLPKFYIAAGPSLHFRAATRGDLPSTSTILTLFAGEGIVGENEPGNGERDNNCLFSCTCGNGASVTGRLRHTRVLKINIRLQDDRVRTTKTPRYSRDTLDYWSLNRPPLFETLGVERFSWLCVKMRQTRTHRLVIMRRDKGIIRTKIEIGRTIGPELVSCKTRFKLVVLYT